MDIILVSYNIKIYKKMIMELEILFNRVIMELIMGEEIFKIMLIKNKFKSISLLISDDII
jgi:hypothetical protein